MVKNETMDYELVFEIFEVKITLEQAVTFLYLFPYIDNKCTTKMADRLQ